MLTHSDDLHELATRLERAADQVDVVALYDVTLVVHDSTGQEKFVRVVDLIPELNRQARVFRDAAGLAKAKEACGG